MNSFFIVYLLTVPPIHFVLLCYVAVITLGRGSQSGKLVRGKVGEAVARTTRKKYVGVTEISTISIQDHL
jgi:hypothetical protein